MDKTPEEQLQILTSRIDSLEKELYRNNFSSHQDFNKTSNFTSKLIIPKLDSLPPICEINEIVGVSGILYICSSANTWALVGTQS